MVLPQNTLILTEDNKISLYAADYRICDVNLPSEFLLKQTKILKQRQRARQMV